MKILVLASNPDLYSNQRLMAEGAARGHQMEFVKINQCYMNITSSQPKLFYRGGDIACDVDAVIPRIRPAITFYGTAVLRQFEMMEVYCANGSVAISKSRDKLRCLQLLAKKGVPMPITGFANSPMDTKNLLKEVGGAPVVIKLLEGTQGKGVVLGETSKAAESVMNAFKSLKANILVQEFIKESAGTDIRCFVIGNKVVAAMKRQSEDGDFRSNLHCGGKGYKMDITPDIRRIAVKAANVMGLKVAGVDIIMSNTGPKVLEINSSPGLEGIEEVSGKNIAGMIIEHVEKAKRGPVLD